MDITIYAICHPDTEEICYVGKTNNLKRRIYEYKKNKTSTLKEVFLEELRKKGKEPIFKVLEICDETNWSKREKYYIKKYKLLDSLNVYKGILKNEISIDNINDKKALNELLCNATFYRFNTPIRIQKYYVFNLLAQLSNEAYYLVYDNRNNFGRSNGYYHIYIRREDSMPVPSNYTGSSYKYSINKNFVMRYPIPQKHSIYKMNTLELPIIETPIACFWQRGVVLVE